jgi:hypothetical protein
MVARTFIRCLRAFAGRKPFKPFIVERVSGERIRIHHSEALAFQAGVAVYITPRGDFELFDHEGVAAVVDQATGAPPS